MIKEMLPYVHFFFFFPFSFNLMSAPLFTTLEAIWHGVALAGGGNRVDKFVSVYFALNKDLPQVDMSGNVFL